MRNLIIFMVLAGLFVVGSRSCHFDGPNFDFGPGFHPQGAVTTETRSLSDFHTVDLGVSGDVEISQGESFNVSVTTNSDLMHLLRTKVDNGRLVIDFEENVSGYEKLLIQITMPKLDGISVGGSGNVVAKTPIQSEFMDLVVAGSGDIRIDNLTTNNLDADIAGSGNISLGGSASDADFSIAGSGDVDAKNLKTLNCSAEISGSGGIECHVQEKLKAAISGSGDVFYSGEPQTEVAVSGSGSVQKR